MGRVGERLVEAGKITPGQLVRALGYQRMVGCRIGEAVIRMRYASATDVLRTVADHLKVPYTYVGDRALSGALLRLLPERMMADRLVLPVRELPGSRPTLFVATPDPTNLHLLDDVARVTRKGVRGVLGSEKDLRAALRRHGIGVRAPAPAPSGGLEQLAIFRGAVAIP